MDADAWRSWSRRAPAEALRYFRDNQDQDDELEEISNGELDELIKRLPPGVSAFTLHLEDDDACD